MTRAPQARDVNSGAPAPGSTCPFCEIIAGTGPADIVRRWPEVIAFIPLNPRVDGHTLIVPHRHIEHPHDDTGASGEAWRCALDLAQSRGGDYNLIINAGASATQTIPHVHLHYLPRRPGDAIVLPWTDQHQT